ncbi:MAG: hypothetical protein J6U95_01540 [Alistipes sp.]|nr:hypothetical protein [Alistipes sp.]
MMTGIPLLFGVLTRDCNAVRDSVVAFYVFTAFGSALFATAAMRERGRKTMEMTIPVSNEERIVFMVLNSALFFPLMSMVTGVLALVLGIPFYYGDYSLVQIIGSILKDYYFDYPFYLSIVLISSCCLLINLLARRKLFVAYLLAFIGFIVFCVMLENIMENTLFYDPEFNKQYFFLYVDSDRIEFWAKVIYSLMPILFYILSYVALRKRQMKW